MPPPGLPVTPDHSPQGEEKPFRRAVFFIAGFDPKGAKFLYWMFRQECAKAARVEGRPTEVGALERDADNVPVWRIECADGGRPVVVDYRVLSPREVVHGHYYRRNVFGLIAAYIVVLHGLIRSGALRRILRLPFLPVALFAYVLVAVPFFFWVGAELAYWPLTLVLPSDASSWAWAGGRIVGGLIFLQAIFLFERAIWLYFFVSALRLAALQARGRAHALDRMVENWIHIVAARQAEGRYDEVLIVGHSVGTIQAVELAARLAGVPNFAGRLALMTLGAAEMPLSYQSCARAFRATLAKVATARGVVWKEYYSPTDAICRGAADPVAAAEIDLGGRTQTGPEMTRIDAGAMLTPANLRRFAWNLVKQHFLYVTSGDHASGYSYFRTICQAQRLS